MKLQRFVDSWKALLQMCQASVCLSDGILLLAGQRSGVAGLSGPGANNHNHTHYCLVITSSHHQADTEAVIWISILSIISIISRRHYQLVVPRLSHVPGLTVTQGQWQCLARWGLCEVIDMFSESGHLHRAIRILDCRYRQDTGETAATWDNAQVRSTISVGKE